MVKITIEQQNGAKIEYTVPNHLADAIDSLVMMYPHTYVKYEKEQEHEVSDLWK